MATLSTALLSIHPPASLQLPSIQVVDRAAEAGLVPADRALAAGLYEVNKSWSAKAVDIDADGDEDVWIGDHQWGSKVWSNDGDGTYTRYAAQAWPRVNADGKITDRHDCAFADVDGNGLPDSYCSAGRNETNVVKNGMDNELWMQSAPGAFQEVGTAWGLGDLCGRGRFVTFLDANGDAYPDIFLGNSSPRNVADPCDSSASGLPDEASKLFLNQGGTGFSYRPDLIAPAPADGQRCAEVLDYNNDGWDDLLTCRFKDWTPRLYRNNQGNGFTEVSVSAGVTAPFGDAKPVDLDGDGDEDLIMAGATTFRYQLNVGGRFAAPVTIATAPSGSEGRAIAAGDADGDGDIDVYALISNIDNLTNPNDVLLLNDGQLHFTPVAVPSAGGTGDEVIAVHPDGPSTTQFLVLNGYNATAGPVQLIAVPPATDPGPNVPPTASFAVTCTGTRCDFDAGASTDPDGTVVDFHWDFGDGVQGGGRTVRHTYAADGAFPVTLTVTDSRGDTGSASQGLDVVNQSPAAVVTASCFGRTCVVDASSSSDADGFVIDYSWDFGDGTSASGSRVTHTYEAAGTYSVGLTVTDNRGATGQAAKDVQVDDAVVPIGFRAAAKAAGASSARPRVTVPTSVIAGDTLLLFVTNGASRTPSVPAGWTRLDGRSDNELRTDVYWRTAVQGDPGSNVEVALLDGSGVAQVTANTLTLAAFSGVSGSPIAAYSAAVEPSTTAVSAHITPGVSVETPGSWVLSYWADRTSTATGLTSKWTVPVGQQLRADAYSSTTGGRVSSLLTDDGAPAPVGLRAGLAATANGRTFKATLWSIVLRPS